MASTYAPIEALEFGNSYVKKLATHPVEARILDDAATYMWMAAPWRWTIGNLSPITLTTNTQDYNITKPSDFLYLLDGYISDKDNPARGIRAESVIPSTPYIQGEPLIYAVTGSVVRTWPTIGTIVGGRYIIPYYKKTSTRITNETMHTAGIQVFDDEWFHVYQDGVLYYLYKFADDQRAGTATLTNNGQIQYSGQLAIFEAGLQKMRLREKLPNPEMFMRNIPDFGMENK